MGEISEVTETWDLTDVWYRDSIDKGFEGEENQNAWHWMPSRLTLALGARESIKELSALWHY